MYTANSIRNICLLGHSGSGKSALAESLLYMTGVIDRMGKNADGNTVSDYDPEEIRRNISISTSVIPLDYKGARINLLDTPGGFDFSGAVVEALRAADAAILVCSAKDGITVGFEKAWKYCEERNMPRFIYISKVDEENSDYNTTFNALREKYGNFVMVESNLEFEPEAKNDILKTVMVDKKLPDFGKNVQRVNYEDGCKVYFDDASFVICRFSGTEPLLRIFAEASTGDVAQGYIDAWQKMLFN